MFTLNKLLFFPFLRKSAESIPKIMIPGIYSGYRSCTNLASRDLAPNFQYLWQLTNSNLSLFFCHSAILVGVSVTLVKTVSLH